jgi:hypothetical protein
VRVLDSIIVLLILQLQSVNSVLLNCYFSIAKDFKEGQEVILSNPSMCMLLDSEKDSNSSN